MASNKQPFRDFIDQVFNGGDLTHVDVFFHDDYTVNAPSMPVRSTGPDAFRAIITILRTAFPDLHMAIRELVEEGDLLVNRFTTTGTHTGPLLGASPTGLPVRVDSLEMHRFHAGRVAESWIVDDMPGIFHQLGLPFRAGPPASGEV